MPLGPRRRGRGVVGTVATAAVVGGTMGAVQHHQQQKWAGQEQAQYDAPQQTAAQQQAAYEAGQQSVAEQQQAQQMAQMQQQLEAMQAQQAAPAAVDNDLLAQLNQLAQLHASGVLDDAEFAAAKAKLLG
jgi:hypothetical protein